MWNMQGEQFALQEQRVALCVTVRENILGIVRAGVAATAAAGAGAAAVGAGAGAGGDEWWRRLRWIDRRVIISVDRSIDRSRDPSIDRSDCAPRRMMNQFADDE